MMPEIVCRNCGKDDFREGRGEYVCQGCGLCEGQVIAEAEERRTFSDSSIDHRRTNGPTEIEEFLGTSLGTTWIDGRSKQGKLLQRSLQQIQPSTHTSLQKDAMAGFKHFEGIAASMKVSPQVIATAKNYFIQFVKNPKSNGKKGIRSREFALAILFHAGKRHGLAQSVRDLTCMGGSNVIEKKLRGYIKLIYKVIPNVVKCITKPDDFLTQFCSDLGLPFKIEVMAREVVNSQLSTLFEKTGMRSSTIASVAVFLACEKAKHQNLPGFEEPKFENIAFIGAIEPETLRGALRTLKEKQEEGKRKATFKSPEPPMKRIK